MLSIALKMLFGDRTKYVTLVLGLAFATLLMNQQGAIFLGLLIRSTGPLQNVHQPDLWVTDPSTRFIAEFRSLADQKLSRVRSVPGVRWAEPLFTAYAVVEVNDGTFQRVQLMGLPRNSLVGRPPQMIEGSLEDIRIPDAVIVEETALQRLAGLKIGDELKLNDKRAVVAGICRAKKGFESNLVFYTTYENAMRFTPVGRKNISYILVKAQEGADLSEVRTSINALGDVAAFTRMEMAWRTIDYIIKETGIGINFGITILLGFVVGLLLSAAVFYQFTIENLRHFAVLKALGARGATLVGMVLLQAMVVGVIGYGIGVGFASLFSILSREANSELDVLFPWQLMLGSFVATIVCIVLASILSMRRVVAVAPARVFAGT